MANKCFIKQNGVWQPLRPAKKVNGQWVDCPVYLKQNGQWVRIDQQLVTKTVVIEGYAQWNGSWRNTTGSGEAHYYRSDNIYQGKYSNYHYATSHTNPDNPLLRQFLLLTADLYAPIVHFA